ncbi:1,2-phenylacetyl-CoA epoxidase subunit PaaD [Flavihumibacter fluvii]|uniref:1,2-phenylacetyl-CoA epoxidase subunit PaaD n=1 Tax=Flavihumibacter fluvii TaxID=2838157 RepID=UPI001BDF3B40|nr:1,2-phenylacetyl-CoA epoxidase subunit PaaD [Flavihumibacter fluvii]ULQ51380.1 phenylacetate-CoA oxygenase subunit PaaJ [Flavihumibacter fluvii]
MLTNTTIPEAESNIWRLLENVMDPEIPVLSVVDLGIIREIKLTGHSVEVVLTPTYTGCPAMDVIRMQIKMQLSMAGYSPVAIKSVLSPAWTTEWMSEAGKEKLKAYGIAPPNVKQTVCTPAYFQREEAVQCPHCRSYHTTMISEFGSTACKSLYRCLDCREPFDYFKCH